MWKIPIVRMSPIWIFLSLMAMCTAQQGCPPLSCPANCDVARGPNGCNVCNCPQPPVCPPLPGCPSNCQQRFDDVGCPMCDCGSDGTLCAALPSCPRGCIARNPTTNCFICNCSPARNPFGGFGNIGNGGFGGGAGLGGGSFGGAGVGGRPIIGNGFGGGAGTFGGGVFGNTGFTGQQCRRLQCPLNCRQVMGRDGCMQCMCDDDALLCPGIQACYDRCQSLNENGCCDCTCPVNPGSFFGGPPGGSFGPFGPVPPTAGGGDGGGPPSTSGLLRPSNSAAERFIPQNFPGRTPNVPSGRFPPQNFRGQSPSVSLLRGRRPSIPLTPTRQPAFGQFPAQNPALQPQNPQRFPLQTPNFQPGAFQRNPQRFPSQRPNIQGLSSSPQGLPIGTNLQRFPSQGQNVAFPNIGQIPNFQGQSSSSQGFPIGTNPNGLIPGNSRFPSTFVPTVNSQNFIPQQPAQPNNANRVVTLTSVTTLGGDGRFNPIPGHVPTQLANPAPTSATPVPVSTAGTLVQPVAPAAVENPAPSKASRVLTLTQVTTIAER